MQIIAKNLDNDTMNSGLRDLLTKGKSRQSQKRRARKHERIAAHYKLLLMKFLNAIGAPDCAFDYCAGLVAVVGYDHSEIVELHDFEFAVTTLGATHRLSKADRETKIQRETARRRKQRQKIIKWQSEATAPELFEFDGKFNRHTGKRNANYRIFFTDALRDLAADVEPGSTDDRIDRAVRVRASEYHERFTGEARVMVTKQIQSPESEFHRAATKAKKAFDQVAKEKGLDAAIDLYREEFLSRFPQSEYPFLHTFQKANPHNSNILSSVTSEKTVTNFPGEIAHTPVIRSAADFDSEHGQGFPAEFLPDQPTFALDATKPKAGRALELGMAVEDFIAQTFNDPAAPTADMTSTLPGNGWRDLPPTLAQFDLLRRGNVIFAGSTRGEASDRINDLISGGGLTDWLSLIELQQFDRRGGHEQGHEKRFCCPLCGQDKPLDADHRSLSANDSTGKYFCHRCEAKGILREFLTTQPAAIPVRQFPAPTPKPAKPDDDRWRKFVFDAKPIIGTPGAAYIESRGFSADIAQRAGVRFGRWWKSPIKEGGKPEPFQAVIFELIDREGQLVAAQARAITGDTKRTRGQKLHGVFEATPGALHAARVAICEAPIDALALAAVGLPAIAICGKTWPEWLAEMLAGREVLIATDADRDGDIIANNLAELMRRTSPVRRLRPAGGKDWAAVAQRHGLDSVAEQVAVALGDDARDEMHESSLLCEVAQ